MSKQTINIGTTANDKTGDSLRGAFQKVNANFTELYTALGLADTTLNLGAFTFTDSVMSTDDSTNITIDRPITVNGEITVDGDILPSVTLTTNLGSPNKKFHSLYVGTGSVYIGDAILSLEGGKLQSSVGFATESLNIGGVNVTVNEDGALYSDGGFVGASVGTVDWVDITDKPTIISNLDTDGIIGFTNSDTITEEFPGGTVSQTTTLANQITVDSTDTITISNSITQVVNDGVTTATDSTGTTFEIGTTSGYIKRYVEPDGPNNSSYFQFITSNSGAVVEGVNEVLGGNTYGRLSVTQGVVVISAGATGVDKDWSFDYEGNMLVPEASSIIGTNDFGIESLVEGNNSGVFLNGNTLVGTAMLYAHRNAIIRSDNNGDAKDWVFNAQGDLVLPNKWPVQFTAVFDEAHYNGEGTFQGDGTVSFTLALQGLGATFQWLADDPTFDSTRGYVGQQAFRYTEADHGITGYNLDITMELLGEGTYSLNVGLSSNPTVADLAKIRSSEEMFIKVGNKGWIFDTSGDIYLPASGDIRNSEGVSVLGTFTGNLGTNTLTQSNSYTRTTTAETVDSVTPAIVWTGVDSWISSAKLTIQIEANETGDNTGWHTQTCEAVIAARGNSGEPHMTVYAVTHTSTNPLVTFTVSRNITTGLTEVTATPTATAAGQVNLRIHSVEMLSRD